MRGQAEMRMNETADVVWFIVREMQKRCLQLRCQECIITAQAVEPTGQGPQQIWLHQLALCC